MLTWLFQKVGILFTVIAAPAIGLILWLLIVVVKLILEGNFK